MDEPQYTGDLPFPEEKAAGRKVKYFCMPSDFKTSTIDEYVEVNHRYEPSKVIETYGQLTVDSVFGSCRSPKSLPQVDRTLLESYIKYSLDRGIDFNYILNATCMENDELTKTGYAQIKDFLKMLQEIGVRWVTISLPSLIEIVKYAAPDLKIKTSTVAQINSPHKAKFYEDLGIRRIVLDEDIYRRFDILGNIRKIYSGDLEIIVNSFCFNDCPYKMFHYNSFSHSNIDKEKYSYFKSRCGALHIGAENYMKLNWIRPEDIHFYAEAGIQYFKLQGRTNVYDGNPAKAVAQYMEGFYEGDLISLLELFSPSKPLTLASTRIENRKLDGFFDKFVKTPEFCTKVCTECGYCRTFAEKSISSSDIAILDMMRMFSSIRLEEFPKALE